VSHENSFPQIQIICPSMGKMPSNFANMCKALRTITWAIQGITFARRQLGLLTDPSGPTA
jgi:hypothetical protein